MKGNYINYKHIIIEHSLLYIKKYEKNWLTMYNLGGHSAKSDVLRQSSGRGKHNPSGVGQPYNALHKFNLIRSN